MIEIFETSRAVVKRHFSKPCDTPEQGEQLIRTALPLCVLGCLTDSQPVTVFAQNKTRKLISFSTAGQLSAFYEELQQEIHALLSEHLVHRAKDDPETAIVEIIGQMSRYDRAACERGKMLLDWHSKVLAQVGVTG